MDLPRPRLAGAAAVRTAALLLALAAALAAQTRQTGDVAVYLNAIPLPGARSEAFRIPTLAQIAAWREVLAKFLAADLLGAARLADPLGYDLILFADPSRGREYQILRERPGGAGQGTFVLQPAACRRLAFQAPHAGGDLNTGSQSVQLFLDLDAFALFLAGAHRCANTEASGCDGTTTVCTGSSAPYPVSDVAHFTRSFFHAAHEELMRRVPNAIAVQMHGFTWETGDPDLMVSNATCADREPSLATQLAAAYNRAFAGEGLALRAGSCNQTGGPDRLCAQTNVQARFLAGTADPCACAGGGNTCASGNACVKTLPYPERFLHIEQSCATRNSPTCDRPGRFSYAQTVAVFRDLFPCFPKLNAYTHGATFEVSPLAPGAFFSLFGEYLGAGARIQACGQPAPLAIDAGSGQWNAVLPGEERESCRVSVSLGGAVPLESNALEVPVREQALALFTWTGGAVATNARGLITAGNPARRGEIVTLWATGGGAVERLAGLDWLRLRPAIVIAGVAARIAYAGRAPGFLGLDQINVEVPANAAPGLAEWRVAERVYRLPVE